MRGEWFRRKTSLLEETFLKRNLHLMVARRNEKRKEIWCVSSARNQDTLNMIVLSTKVKPKGEKRRQLWPLGVKVKNPLKKKIRKK